ncbi:SDR family NAD(P)-dependent oxidoreductase [Burkholderia cenocepacia]|uniref:SDR family NAD(P)-dependent oxidoreductase n=1 Tax=Burkholderia cenocepacia TaxID=95486 RepID=UPI002AB66D74|nr:SDR family NAD(P)-dependent oxidoreductase [Burkholderia cenocepacia]
MGILDNKVCVVTGGAGSIGAATARVFLKEGARVMLVDLDETALARLVDELGSDRVACAVADAGCSRDVQKYVNQTVEQFGKIDVMFSNAGNTGMIAELADYPEDVFDSVMRVHVRGAFLACKYGLAAMNDGGSIVITSSVAGVRGDPGVYAYVTAKHAQVGLMRAVAKEAARRGIRVNTIHPGPVKNSFQAEIEQKLSAVLERDATKFFDDMIPLRRHATPEEIARSVLYLASDHSSFTTGSTLMVDGGMSA